MRPTNIEFSPDGRVFVAEQRGVIKIFDDLADDSAAVFADLPAASNLHVIDEWLDDAQLRALMQRSGVHLCPSNAEGFGHTIVEAMSCGVLVLTTDLEPMNELARIFRWWPVMGVSRC